MKGRTVLLFVVLALVTALVGFYAGMSTSSPRAAADTPVRPARLVRGTRPGRQLRTVTLVERLHRPGLAGQGLRRGGLRIEDLPAPGLGGQGFATQEGRRPGR